MPLIESFRMVVLLIKQTPNTIYLEQTLVLSLLSISMFIYFTLFLIAVFFDDFEVNGTTHQQNG